MKGIMNLTNIHRVERRTWRLAWRLWRKGDRATVLLKFAGPVVSAVLKAVEYHHVADVGFRLRQYKKLGKIRAWLAVPVERIQLP